MTARYKTANDSTTPAIAAIVAIRERVNALALEGAKHPSRLVGALEIRPQRQCVLKRLTCLCLVADLQVCETEMITEDRIFQVLFDALLKRADRKRAQPLLVIHPPQCVTGLRVIGGLRLGGLGRLRCAVRVFAVLRVHPGEVVGGDGGARVELGACSYCLRASAGLSCNWNSMPRSVVAATGFACRRAASTYLPLASSSRFCDQ